MPDSKVQADFDRIALLSDEAWCVNSHYHGFLLRQLPSRCTDALEIGCGTGAFARLLAQRAAHVLGLDLSAEMIRLARERSQACPHIEYRVADVTACNLGTGQYDCVASIATMHHLPLALMLARIRDALRPGGVLAILDLYEAEGPADLLFTTVAVPAHCTLMLARRGRLREPRAVREAWDEHGKIDHYSTLSEVRHTCAGLLPGARVRRHLLWRYSIVWRKTSGS